MSEMTFDQFHRLYAAVRAQLNRADDLLEDAVVHSTAITPHGELLDILGEQYDLIAAKREGIRAEVSVIVGLDNPPSAISATVSMVTYKTLEAYADLVNRTVKVATVPGYEASDQITDFEGLIDVLTPESANGAETMEYYDRKRFQTPAEYNAERAQDGEKAARMILAGIGRLPELDAYETPHVAQAVVRLLKEPAPFGQAARIERARAWADDPRLQPEWAIFVRQSLEALA